MQVLAWVLASAAGAGFAVTAELKRLVDENIKNAVGDYELFIPAVDQQESLIDDFFDKANIATAILFLAFLSMATLLLLSPFNRIKPLETTTQDPEAQAKEPTAPGAPSSWFPICYPILFKNSTLYLNCQIKSLTKKFKAYYLHTHMVLNSPIYLLLFMFTPLAVSLQYQYEKSFIMLALTFIWPIDGMHEKENKKYCLIIY